MTLTVPHPWSGSGKITGFRSEGPLDGTRQAAARCIQDYIAQDSPRYAIHVIDRLTRRSQQLAQFPNSGRIVREFEHSDVREVIEPPYRIVYRVRQARIDVLTVFHGARPFPGS